MGLTLLCVCVCFQLVTSRVSYHGHVIVQLQFFETVVRYDKFFQTEPEHIPDTLVSEHVARFPHHRLLCEQSWSSVPDSLVGEAVARFPHHRYCVNLSLIHI